MSSIQRYAQISYIPNYGPKNLKILVFSYWNYGSRFEYFCRRFAQEHAPSALMAAPNSTRRALSNDMLRLSLDQIMIFAIIDGAMGHVKVIIFPTENVSISLDTARRVEF
jgi:hypothetical protein